MSRLSCSAVLRKLALLACLLWTGLAAAEVPPLKIGIMPFNSALALIRTHQPLTQYLEKALGRRVVVYTSVDYFTYVNQLLDGQFDLAITGPHFGSMAMARGATPLFRYRADLQPVFVVRKEGTIDGLEDLRGTRIGLSSRLSISSIGGIKWLQDNGFMLGNDYQLAERSTHGAAIASVAVGELDAALTTYTPLKQIPPDVREKIRILPLDIHVPHLMTLADARQKPADVARLRKALLDFADSEDGRKFFTDTGYLGYVAVSDQDLAALRPFVDLTLQMMRLQK